VPNLPTALDQKLIARATLRADSFARWQNLDNFEDAALDWLAAEKSQLGAGAATCLQRLQRPTCKTYRDSIVDDFTSETSGGVWNVRRAPATYTRPAR